MDFGERKAGELLRSTEKAKGGRPKTSGAGPGSFCADPS
jgi:hypothetical protein